MSLWIGHQWLWPHHMDQCYCCSCTVDNTFCSIDIQCEHNKHTYIHMVKLINFCVIQPCWYIMSFGCMCIKCHNNSLYWGKIALNVMSLSTVISSRCEHKILVVASIWSENASLPMKHALSVSSISTYVGGWCHIMLKKLRYIGLDACLTNVWSVCCLATTQYGAEVI